MMTPEDKEALVAVIEAEMDRLSSGRVSGQFLGGLTRAIELIRAHDQERPS